MKFKVFLPILLILIFILTPLSNYAAGIISQATRFTDVPKGSLQESAIYDLVSKNVFPSGSKFGYGTYIKRQEFITYIVWLMKWDLNNPTIGSFIDNKNKSLPYYRFIETALQKGIIVKDSSRIRPNDAITREELAVMLVRCAGYEALNKQLSFLGKPTLDVNSNSTYITIVKDLGLMDNTATNKFSPGNKVKKEDAAVILERFSNKSNAKINFLHAFYAMQAYTQKELIQDLSSVSFGWSQLEFDKASNQVVLNMTNANKNSFTLPVGFSDPVNFAKDHHVSTQLNVFASQDTIVLDENSNNKTGLIQYIISSPSVRSQVIDIILANLNSTQLQGETASFDGVVIDFENLRGLALRRDFCTFLSELKSKLSLINKKLYVAVHPARKPGQSYYDGYDFKNIGNIADKVILMAHDYNAKSLTQIDMNAGNSDTPLTPIDEIYYALKTITDKQTGVSDINKIVLQISFGSAQWQTKDGVVQNQDAYGPSYAKIMERFVNKDMMKNVKINYASKLENPYLTYYDTKGIYNKVWYEDTRSVLAKIKLAKMFGIHGISLWRLGNIPSFNDTLGINSYMDVWQQIGNNTALK